MRLTEAQWRSLRWLEEVGGSAHTNRGVPCACKDGQHVGRLPTGATMSFLGLLAAGAIAGGGGYIKLTDQGRAFLAPFGRSGDAP